MQRWICREIRSNPSKTKEPVPWWERIEPVRWRNLNQSIDERGGICFDRVGPAPKDRILTALTGCGSGRDHNLPVCSSNKVLHYTFLKHESHGKRELLAANEIKSLDFTDKQALTASNFSVFTVESSVLNPRLELSAMRSKCSTILQPVIRSNVVDDANTAGYRRHRS
jgi:hypothetical protein